VPFLPIGSIDIDRTYNVDARLSRTIPFSERVRAACSLKPSTPSTPSTTPASRRLLQRSGRRHSCAPGHNGISHVGDGSASQGFPDGTNARVCRLDSASTSRL